ncbi:MULTISPECIES: SPW repeat domain-containing protein [Hymenobacter]|uniref:Uncharacterized protein n=2 Tax=Hymenobacter TaxID=89966 RepID=A0ABS6X1I8_9BACT|nr:MULTISPECIES: hypothetical protein [Hymenobacter]MBO3271799.1 hypothetical protein [Hymenobacter defluvii]MBW3129712.1 hypothetical protein [Hymenobacter profundi]QNE38662.1 hypothetical protein F1C16_03385 [Hymenobacter sp. NBH84]
MEQPISRRQHGFTDYSYIPLALTIPKLAGFEAEQKAVTMTRVLAGNILLSSMFTRAEWGLFKKMPYKAHLVLDVAVGVFAASSPWLLGFAKNKAARNAFLLLGTFGILAGTLSKPEEMPEFEQ